MISRFARPRLVLVSALVFASSAFAQPPAASPSLVAGEDTYVDQLLLPDGDIDTILSMLEQLTGRTVLRPGQLPVGGANFNLRIRERIKKSEAILAIETVLALNNIGVTPQGDRFLIISQLSQTSRTAPPLLSGSAFDQPASGRIAAKIFQLEFLRVAEVQPVLQNILNLQLGTTAIPMQTANALMVTDSVANLQRVEALLKELDKPIAEGLRPKFYQLRNGAKASDLMGKIRTVLQSIQPQLAATLPFSADDRTNQLILVTDPRQFPLFDELIERLDVRADPNTRNEVIYLKHATAEELVTVLNSVIRGQVQTAQQRTSQTVRPGGQVGPVQPTVPGAPVPPVAAQPPPVLNPALNAESTNEFSAIMTIAPDKRSNSVVVSGTADDIRLITALIDKLDTVLGQVRIEVVIAEVSLDDSHSSGISQLGLNIEGDRLVGIAGSAPGFSVGGAAANSFATINRIGGPRSLVESLDFTGVLGITTTPRKNNTTVLSVPSITTSHAKAATFVSSEIRPITTGTTSTPVSGTNSNNGFATQQQTTQQDIGITLTVTPLIGSDGSVQLDIDQDVRDVAGNVTVNGNDTPIISHRQTKTTISAKSGDIVVLGGMQRNKDSRATNRLGPIPFLGDLFGSRTKAVTRTELIFFMRPYVLTNTPTDNAAMMERIQQLPDKEVPQKEQIRQLMDPSYVPAKKKGIIDKILPR